MKKAGLLKTTSILKGLIEKGYDFEVNIIKECGGLLFSFPFCEKDCLPHIEYFKKAGATLDEIAYFYAYQVAYGHEVLAINQKEKKAYSLETSEKCKIVDDFKIRKMEEKYLTGAMKNKDDREYAELHATKENKITDSERDEVLSEMLKK